MAVKAGMSLEELMEALKDTLRKGGIEAVMERFKVSQRTAYRWLEACGVRRTNAWVFPDGEIVIERRR